MCLPPAMSSLSGTSMLSEVFFALAKSYMHQSIDFGRTVGKKMSMLRDLAFYTSGRLQGTEVR